jgi:hypothetical protein
LIRFWYGICDKKMTISQYGGGVRVPSQGTNGFGKEVFLLQEVYRAFYWEIKFTSFDRI